MGWTACLDCGSTSFESILFADGRSTADIDRATQPDIFGDLNLDQIIDSVVRGRDEYNLRPYFYIPLADTQAIEYRHAVMRDLERGEVLNSICQFAAQMRAMRTELAASQKMHYVLQKQAYFLDAVEKYCGASLELAHALEQVTPHSTGIAAFLEYLKRYVQGHAFEELKAEEAGIRAELSKLRYSILIKGSSVTVRRYAGEVDYSEQVQKIFAKFRQGAVKSHSVDIRDYPEMNHVEANVLNFVAKLHPEVFEPLDAYCSAHADFLDPVIARFDREIQFYIAFLEHLSRLRSAGLSFCYPVVSTQSKTVRSVEGFDLALAEGLRLDNQRIVCNDFYLEGDERIVVVTGPNQGGKTTFARSFGQLHYLASIGCPVPGREAQLYISDRIFTHFERQEDMKNLRGKLHDDLYRIHNILSRATTESIIIMNEIFSSTSLKDALFLSQKVMGRIMDLDALCVYVTFIEELSRSSKQTISMSSEVKGDSVATRTFKVVRRPADGRSYALSLARQYGLTYEQLRERIRS
ncbi:DNA mismatch repair protein MutS [Paraburkholderia sp. CNPSo 3157]|uniref:DNA mismatch repair protein MutS n=1 Tax=Paraburkholderia franconis TaxID=2654983 RepID=A0A7X1TIC1_9BURK|nr:DNA mismatch repair protein MutS [Paraburkholderia franconis]MPW20280.1 DNA mismatch repair protein MutS [Paraburkholderia franconis]